MAGALITIVETASFLRDAEKLLSENERREVVDLLAADPQCGDVIPAGGGIRKVRFALAGRGKRGGARVIYFFHNRDMPVFVLALFAKNERSDLSRAEIDALAKAMKTLVKQYGA